MKNCTLVIRDEVNVRLEGLDIEIRKKLTNVVKYFIPSARHTPQFKLGRWDGTVNFCSATGHTYLNVLDRLIPILNEAGIHIDVVDKRIPCNFDFKSITSTMFSDFVWPAGHRLAGQAVILLDHQVDVGNRFLDSVQSIQNVATSAGKTLICAALSKTIEPYGRSLIIVPNTSLVGQTEADYRMVGLDVGVWHGEKKESGHQNQVCTWQSLGVFAKKQPNDGSMSIMEFIKNVVCVIVDETHVAKANVLKNLLSGPFANVPLRWGLTGTIPKEEHFQMSLLATIGPVIGTLRAVDLQDKGLLASCHINVIETDDSHVEFSNYEDEHRFLTTDRARLQWLATYIQDLSTTGSTLVLVDRIETGKKLAALMPEAVFVSGATKNKARKIEYDQVQIVDGKIIIATYGVAAIGLSIPRLFHCVLFSPGKSFVRVIQSIGRMLRLAIDKNHAIIHDVSSNLKYSKRHMAKHKEYYQEAEYPFTVSKMSYFLE